MTYSSQFCLAIYSTCVAITLTACTTPTIEKVHDEIKKENVCRLTGLRVQGPINLQLDMISNGDVDLLVSLYSRSYLTTMHSNPKIVLKIFNKTNVEELKLQASSKNWIQDVYEAIQVQKKPSPIPYSSNPYNQDYASTRISKADFHRIVTAQKVEMFIETNRDPARAEFSKENLDWFARFQKECS